MHLFLLKPQLNYFGASIKYGDRILLIFIQSFPIFVERVKIWQNLVYVFYGCPIFELDFKPLLCKVRNVYFIPSTYDSTALFIVFSFPLSNKVVLLHPLIFLFKNCTFWSRPKQKNVTNKYTTSNFYLIQNVKNLIVATVL